MPKKLIIADSAGVCFGVEEAVSTAEKILDENNNVEVKSFGPLIHNPQMVDILNKKGLSVINEIKKNEKGTVIIRHDVDRLAARALNLAEIESNFGIKSTFYFRIKTFQPEIVTKMHSMGHEIGYHYECLSDANGDEETAIRAVEPILFEGYGKENILEQKHFH